MSSTAATAVLPNERLEVLFEELAELAGQRNAIDGRIVDIVAEMDRDKLCGATGARSIAALVAWKLGSSSANAKAITTVAGRLRSSPAASQSCGRAGCHWIRSVSSPHAPATALMSTTRSWLRSPRSTSCAPRSSSNRDPIPTLGPTRSPRSLSPAMTVQLLADHPAPRRGGEVRRGAGVPSGGADRRVETRPRQRRGPASSAADAEHRGCVPAAGRGRLGRRATRRPHGQHTTVVVHVDVEARAAALHLGPLLTDAERQYLSCDATCEVWFERAGRPIGVGRATRTVSRGFAAPWSTATPAARSPAAGPPAGCMPITSGTGKTAAPPSSKTWSWSARITTGHITAATSPSPDPPRISKSPTATGSH